MFCLVVQNVRFGVDRMIGRTPENAVRVWAGEEGNRQSLRSHGLMNPTVIPVRIEMASLTKEPRNAFCILTNNRLGMIKGWTNLVV